MTVVMADDIILICDTREQWPYEFKTPSVRTTLKTGDYSIVGFEDRVAVERKVLGDLISSISFGRARFERELARGKSMDYFALVVESSLLDIVNWNYRSKMTPKSVIQSLVAMSVRHRMPIFFADNRQYAERLTESILLKFVREIEKTEE